MSIVAPAASSVTLPPTPTSQVKDRGILEFDETFDPADKAVQAHLLGVCATARTWPCTLAVCTDGMLVQPTLDKPCVIEALDEFQATRFPGDPSKRVGNMERDVFFEAVEAFTDPALNPDVNSPSRGYPNELGWMPNEDGAMELRYVMQKLDTTYTPPSGTAATEVTRGDFTRPRAPCAWP